MYLRHTTIRKNGKSHTYWRLVRSVRQGSRVRQETVAFLGELDAKGRLKAKALAGWIVGQTPQPDLFEPDSPTSTVAVDLGGIRLERSLPFGAIWLGWTLWQALGLEEVLDGLIEDGREDVSWARMGAILTIARLVGTPKSDLKKYEREILEDNWEKIREGLEVKRCPSPDGEETFILCRSVDRRGKEKAMHDRFIRRIQEGLESLTRRRLFSGLRPLEDAGALAGQGGTGQ